MYNLQRCKSVRDSRWVWSFKSGPESFFLGGGGGGSHNCQAKKYFDIKIYPYTPSISVAYFPHAMNSTVS